MTIQISAFRWVPPFAQGYVRDLWVRWALEEAGLAYRTVLIDPDIQASPNYRAWQPFGLVPAYKDDEVEMFESGAIVIYIAGRSEALAPQTEAGRVRVMAWILAAMNTIEPCVRNFLHLGADAKHRKKLESRLNSLSAWLGAKDFLEDRFTAGDLMMTGVLRELVASGVLAAYPNLDSLRARCEARPAFARAFEAQMQVFRDNAPG